MAPAAELKFGRRGDQSIKGPSAWSGFQVYERMSRDKLQRFAIRDDQTGLGRVYDSRYASCIGEVKFPLGPWKQGEVRLCVPGRAAFVALPLAPERRPRPRHRHALRLQPAARPGARGGQRMKLIVAGASALLMTGCATPPTDIALLDKPGRYDVILPGAGVTLGGVLFRPAAQQGSVPAVIALHGWGESGTNGALRVASLARDLAELGYVGLALSMRGWPPSGGYDDCGLEQPADIARAAEWLATLRGVDGERIGVVGLSQGGQVALLAAARSPRIKAVVAQFAVSDTERWRETTALAGIRDVYVPQTCRPGAPRSPINFADKIGAAVLLIHGDADTRVPTEQSLKMAEALRRSGRSVELKLIAGAGHGFQRNERAQAWGWTSDFLARQLKGQ